MTWINATEPGAWLPLKPNAGQSGFDGRGHFSQGFGKCCDRAPAAYRDAGPGIEAQTANREEGRPDCARSSNHGPAKTETRKVRESVPVPQIPVPPSVIPQFFPFQRNYD